MKKGVPNNERMKKKYDDNIQNKGTECGNPSVESVGETRVLKINNDVI